MDGITKWLLEQISTIVVLGIGMYFLWKEYKAEKVRRTESEKKVLEMSESVVKVTLLYDEHIKLVTKGTEKNTEEHEKIMDAIKKLKG